MKSPVGRGRSSSDGEAGSDGAAGTNTVQVELDGNTKPSFNAELSSVSLFCAIHRPYPVCC